MITEHYDVCIIADSPSTYLTAELLSKNGLRVLLCENNLKNGSQFKPYYPFYFSINGPLMDTIRTLGMEKSFTERIDPATIQIVLPAGRCELYQDTERRANELQWLFGKYFESGMANLQKLRILSEKITKKLTFMEDEVGKITDRISLWFLKKKLSHESRLINIGEEHFFCRLLKNYLSIPLLNERQSPVSPFYSSLLSGDAWTYEGYPDSFINLIREDMRQNIEIYALSDVQVDKNLSYIRKGDDALTFKFMVIDSSILNNLFPASKAKLFKNFIPVSFWFPVQLRIKKDGFPVGMGKYVVLVNPEMPPENANLLFIKTDINDAEVTLNTYSVWRFEELNSKKWVENIVGSVMDHLLEFMPFINRHLLHLIYPEKVEDLPESFFNYLYNLKTSPGLFSPVIKSRLKRRVFIAGPELFPQWGIDADAMSARYVIDKIKRMMKG
jgi:hypothetical protein